MTARCETSLSSLRKEWQAKTLPIYDCQLLIGVANQNTVGNRRSTIGNELMEPIKANEINEIIRAQIENFEAGVTVAEVGSVIKVGDGIAEVHGLEKVMAGELLDFPHDVRGLALNLEEDKVGVVLFGDFQKIKEGDVVKRTGRVMQVPVGP